MTERAIARVLTVFSAAAALALGACNGGSGGGTLPSTSSGTSEQATQIFSAEPTVPSVMYFSHEQMQRSAVALPSTLGQNVSYLPDGGVAHIMHFRAGVLAPNIQANMTYHGGPIEKSPKQVLVLWGFGSCNTTFPSPTCTNDPSHTTEILGHFLHNVGGSHWLGVVTQYSSTAQGHITNPTNTLIAVLIDTAAAPSHPTEQDVINASFAAEQFLVAHHVVTGINKDINYIVALGKNHNPSGFRPGGFCAFHSAWVINSRPPAQPFTEFPYVASAGAGCGGNSVSGPNDGVSITLGHEAAEAITDPLGNAWFDSGGNELGDKCAFTNLGFTTLLSSDRDVVQPLWSNAAHGCVRL